MTTENHFCPIIVAAEKISGNPVDCSRKTECNKATACVLVREYGSWEALTEHFVDLAQKSADLEEKFFGKT
jgi:hypothetical protein